MRTIRLQKPVRGIFFDLGWTLFRPAGNDWFICNKLIEYVGEEGLRNLPEAKKQAVFGRALKYLDDNHRLATEAEEYRQFVEFYSMIAEGLPELKLTRELVEEAARSKVYDMDNYVFYEDSKPVLERLKGTYRLGVISDTWPSAEAILRRGGIYDCFDALTFSCLLGTYKPDERMYLDALAKIGLPPGETVFIDDSKENLDGAANCGIQPVLITTSPYGKNTGKYPAIDRLSDIFDLL